MQNKWINYTYIQLCCPLTIKQVVINANDETINVLHQWCWRCFKPHNLNLKNMRKTRVLVKPVTSETTNKADPEEGKQFDTQWGIASLSFCHCPRSGLVLEHVISHTFCMIARTSRYCWTLTKAVWKKLHLFRFVYERLREECPPGLGPRWAAWICASHSLARWMLNPPQHLPALKRKGRTMTSITMLHNRWSHRVPIRRHWMHGPTILPSTNKRKRYFLRHDKPLGFSFSFAPWRQTRHP